ncbi:hypothetical protein ABZP36_001043 [Zizania latifolia]
MFCGSRDILFRIELSTRRKHLRECRKMCLHAKELPCEEIGRVASHISSFIALDDIGAQEYTQRLLHVLSHYGVRRGISTIFLDHHLGGDG